MFRSIVSGEKCRLACERRHTGIKKRKRVSRRVAYCLGYCSVELDALATLVAADATQLKQKKSRALMAILLAMNFADRDSFDAVEKHHCRR